MATNMLPILLLGGAAFYLLSRGGEDSDEIDDGIDPEVEAMDNVVLVGPSMSAAQMNAANSYPSILVSSTAWPLAEISSRMAPAIAANPGVQFIFIPVDVIIDMFESELGISAEVLEDTVTPDSVLLSAQVSSTAYESNVVGNDWAAFDAGLAASIAYINNTPATREAGGSLMMALRDMVSGASRRRSGLQRLAGQ